MSDVIKEAKANTEQSLHSAKVDKVQSYLEIIAAYEQKIKCVLAALNKDEVARN